MKYFIGLVLGMACFELLCYISLSFIRIFDSIKLKAGIWYIQNNALLFLVLFLLKFSRIYGGKSCDMLVVVDETLFVSFNRDVGTDVEKGFSGKKEVISITLGSVNIKVIKNTTLVRKTFNNRMITFGSSPC